ncbi:MAG: cytochrome c [Bacteriovorax sp.]|jgi:mono/diheme cytochrome c family protein
MKGLNLALTITALTALVSCSESHFKEDKIFAGGVYAPAKVLNDGKSTYTEYCMPCHGVNGDGNGTSAKGLQVPPRNFKLGQYKFGRVVSGELPHDADFYKLLREGLAGTAMLPWKELSDTQMFNLVQYIKSFAPAKWEGADKKLGDVIAITKDPYGDAHKESAIQRGKEVYHVVAQCWTCHRAYVGHAEFSEISQKINGKPVTEFDPDMYHIKLQPNDYGYSSMPPEFTYDQVRSAQTVEELYVRISAGVGGTAMPSWKGTIQDDEIWAVSHYIKYLMDMKNTPDRKKLLEASK